MNLYKIYFQTLDAWILLGLSQGESGEDAMHKYRVQCGALLTKLTDGYAQYANLDYEELN